MKVVVTSTGGWGGFAPVRKAYDLSTLAAPAAHRVDRLVQELRKEEYRSRNPPPGGDAMTHCVEIIDEANERFAVVQLDTEFSPSFAKLIDALADFDPE
jgi:hypothetical protein